jgi:hypothetical protein
MDAQPHGEHDTPQHLERRYEDGILPAQKLLDSLMEGPRNWAQYFEHSIYEQFPAGERDKPRVKVDEKNARIISSQLDSYEEHWLKRHLATISDEYTSIIRSAPEALPHRSELSFHIINQFIMPQWHRLLVSPKYPKMNTDDLEAAQIRLAMESAMLLSSKNAFEDEELLTNELLDIDAMINLLQLSIDGVLYDQPDIIAVPHPEMGTERHQADFLIFESTHGDGFLKTEVHRDEIITTSLPGSAAVEMLNNLRVSSISRRAEFQDKAAFSKLLRARESVRSFTPKQNRRKH